MEPKGTPKGGATPTSHAKPKGGGQSKPKGDGATTKSDYIGHTEDISTYIITDDNKSGSKASQFKEMHDRIVTYASSKYLAAVSKTMETFEVLTMLDFMPPPLDPALYTRDKLDANGDRLVNTDGTVQTEEDEQIKKQLTSMQEHMMKDQTRLWSNYRTGMDAMFRVVYGQVDDNFKNKLEGHKDYKNINATNNTVGLIMLIRDLCYQDARSTVHRLTNLIRTLRKLLTSRQKGHEGRLYARDVIEKFNVLKAIGGNILCPEAIDAVMALDGKSISDYYKMNDTMQSEMDSRVEEAFLGALIVKGCDEERSTLRESLGQQYALGTDCYPTSTT